MVIIEKASGPALISSAASERRVRQNEVSCPVRFSTYVDIERSGGDREYNAIGKDAVGNRRGDEGTDQRSNRFRREEGAPNTITQTHACSGTWTANAVAHPGECYEPGQSPVNMNNENVSILHCDDTVYRRAKFRVNKLEHRAAAGCMQEGRKLQATT